MRLPSKVNTFEESVVALFAPILTKLKRRDMSPHELLEATNTKTADISRFIDALDCLYKLGMIEVPEGTEVLRYVKKNNVRRV